MLPTEVTTGIYGFKLYKGEESLHYSTISKVRNENEYLSKGYHLYITSEDKIKEGDWCIYFKQNQDDDMDETFIFLVEKISSTQDGRKTVNCGGNSFVFIDECKKIIATTDKSLLSSNNIPYPDNRGGLKGRKQLVGHLPQPSKTFIEKYCKVGGINEVMVDYEAKCKSLNALCTASTFDNGCPSCSYCPKINSHNEIIIHPIKNNWSREELLPILNKVFIEGGKCARDFNRDFTPEDFIKTL